MTNANYIFILIWPAFVALLANATGGKKPKKVDNSTKLRYIGLWPMLFLIPMIILAARRNLSIGDSWAYYTTFMQMPEHISELSGYMNGVTKDEFFYFVSALIRIYITKNRYVYFGIIAAAQLLMLSKTYKKYSEEYFLSMFLFIASTDYISWVFNGMRQFVAVCITFIAFPFILKKRYLPAVLLIVFASLFHGSALFLLPFIFIAQGKAWNNRTVLFLFAVIIIVASIDQFTDLLDDMLSDTQYQNVVSDWTNSDDDGTNVLRVLVYSVPAIISLYGRRKIKEANDPVINLSTNMSIVSAGIYIVSMFTSGIFIGRLPIYFSLYSYILLPWEVKHIFNDSTAKLVKIAMIMFYFLFYAYSIFMQNSNLN